MLIALLAGIVVVSIVGMALKARSHPYSRTSSVGKFSELSFSKRISNASLASRGKRAFVGFLVGIAGAAAAYGYNIKWPEKAIGPGAEVDESDDVSASRINNYVLFDDGHTDIDHVDNPGHSDHTDHSDIGHSDTSQGIHLDAHHDNDVHSDGPGAHIDVPHDDYHVDWC